MIKVRVLSGEVDIDPLLPSSIRIGDIVHSLANQNRYNGNTVIPWPVAAHAVRVYRHAKFINEDPAFLVSALHHDSAETYIGDIIQPIKQHLDMRLGHTSADVLSLETFENRLLRTIITRYSGMWPIPQEVKDLDMFQREMERDNLFPRAPGSSRTVEFMMGARDCRQEFLAAHSELQRRLGCTI